MPAVLEALRAYALVAVVVPPAEPSAPATAPPEAQTSEDVVDTARRPLAIPEVPSEFDSAPDLLPPATPAPSSGGRVLWFDAKPAPLQKTAESQHLEHIRAHLAGVGLTLGAEFLPDRSAAERARSVRARAGEVAAAAAVVVANDGAWFVEVHLPDSCDPVRRSLPARPEGAAAWERVAVIVRGQLAGLSGEPSGWQPCPKDSSAPAPSPAATPVRRHEPRLALQAGYAGASMGGELPWVSGLGVEVALRLGARARLSAGYEFLGPTGVDNERSAAELSRMGLSITAGALVLRSPWVAIDLHAGVAGWRWRRVTTRAGSGTSVVTSHPLGAAVIAGAGADFAVAQGIGVAVRGRLVAPVARLRVDDGAGALFSQARLGGAAFVGLRVGAAPSKEPGGSAQRAMP